MVEKEDYPRHDYGLHSMRKEIKQDLLLLEQAVNDVIGADLTTVSRKKEWVLSRMVFCTLALIRYPVISQDQLITTFSLPVKRCLIPHYRKTLSALLDVDIEAQTYYSQVQTQWQILRRRGGFPMVTAQDQRMVDGILLKLPALNADSLKVIAVEINKLLRGTNDNSLNLNICHNEEKEL